MRSAVQLTGETLLPSLSENLLATYLALLGGPLVSIAYRGTLQAFEWLSPILPNLSWTVNAFLGTLIPALGLLAIHNQVAAQPASEVNDAPQSTGSVTAWVTVAVIAVLFLGFNTGMFGVRPSLIASGSMLPTLSVGDIVITKNVQPEEVAVGDIIRFRQEGVYTIHRVKAINESSHQYTFITRGDANNADDPPVLDANLAGKVILTVPKLGWVSIAAREAFAWLR